MWLFFCDCNGITLSRLLFNTCMTVLHVSFARNKIADSCQCNNLDVPKFCCCCRIHFYPIALKGCWGIVFTHGVWMDGREKFVWPVSQKLYGGRKLILGRDIG